MFTPRFVGRLDPVSVRPYDGGGTGDVTRAAAVGWERRGGSRRRAQDVGEPVAEEREAEGGEHDGDPRHGRQPRMGGHEDLPLVDHRAPVRGRRLDAEAEVAEGDDGEDDEDDVGHGVDDRLRHHVREHVACEHPAVAEPSPDRRLQPVLLAGDEGGGAGDAGVDDPVGEEEGDVDAVRALADDEDEGDDEHIEGKGEHDVDDPPDHRVEPAAEVAGEDADRRAHGERAQDRQHPDLDVGAAAVEQAAPDVTAEVVGAEQMGGARALEGGEQVLLHRRVAGDHRGEEDEDEHRADDGGAGEEARRA
jgi:hypothetical protein